jgi:hypothetical protein
MSDANVKLSESELLLVCDEQFILTKNNIISKVYLLFGMLSEVFLRKANANKSVFPEEVLMASPKIYKGENYRGLPYVMMDFPRYFVKEDVFSIRCFFWWGNFFSITLHLAGTYAKKYSENVFQKLSQQNDHWYACINEDQWEHHFNEENYILFNQLWSEQFGKRKFQKIAKKISLHDWDKAYDFFEKNYNEMLALLKTNG